MNNQEQSIYQSGQNVLIDGWYEAIAVTVSTVVHLTIGKSFPNYDGRAICWHLLKPQLARAEERPGSFGEGMRG